MKILLPIFLCLGISTAQAKFEEKTKINPVGFEYISSDQFKGINSRIHWKLENNQGLTNYIPRKTEYTYSNVNKQGSNIITIGPEAASTCDSQFSDLQAVIEAAPDGSEIHMASGTYEDDLANFNIYDKSITIIGGYSQDCQTFNSLAKTTISLTNAADEVIDVFPDSTEITIELTNLVIEGGANNDGGIYIHQGSNVSGKAKVYLTNSVVRNNHGTQSGGIKIEGGSSLFVESGSSVQSNKSDANGGGINCLGSEVFITNSLVGLNKADENDNGDGNGGGLFLDNCDLLIYSHGLDISGIAFNTAIKGAGIFATNSSDVYIVGQNTSVGFNTASLEPLSNGNGGGVFIKNNSQLSIYSAKIESNKAFVGAGLYVGSNSSLLTGRNYATLEECSVAQCTRIINNEAKSDDRDYAYSIGGGIFAEPSADITINQAWISGNKADFASALKFNANNSSVKHSMIINNTTNAKPLGDIAATVRINSGSQVDFMFNTLAGNVHGDINAPVLSVPGVVQNANITANIIQENTFVTAPVSIDVDNVSTTIQCEYNLLEANTATDDCSDASNLDGGNEAAFVDAANNNYHISSQSLAIDHAAAVSTSIDETDIDNDEIIIADAGADEAPINRVGINRNPCAYPTINQALQNATDGDVIYLKPGIYSELINLNKDIGLYGASSDCKTAIAGSTSDTVIIDGAGITDFNSLVFILSDKIVELKNLTIQNSNSGGLVWYGTNNLQTGLSSLTNVSVINNQTSFNGAGLYLNSKAVVKLFEESSISNNFVIDQNGKGGGAYIGEGALLQLWNNSYVGKINQPNIADNGGGIYLAGGDFELRQQSKITANLAGLGGGIYAENNSNITLFDDSQIGNNIIGNTANQNGGGVFLQGIDSFITLNNNSKIAYNSANNGSGGGIYSINKGNVIINSGVFESNAANINGGGIYYSDAASLVSKALFKGNDANLGSAIYVGAQGLINLNNSLVVENSGSASFYSGAGTSTTINNVTFADNERSLNISDDNFSFVMTNSIVWGDSMSGFVSTPFQGECNIDEFGVLSDNTQDPLFETGSGFDYLLSVNSPAIDTCLSSNTLDFFDTVHSYDGNLHASSNEGDMGAFEYIPLGSQELTVNKIGTGTGTVISEFGDINCGSTCSDDYPIGLNVTLQTTVDIGTQFVGWSGGVCSGTGDCIVTLDQSLTVTAEFNTDSDHIFKNDFE